MKATTQLEIVISVRFFSKLVSLKLCVRNVESNGCHLRLMFLNEMLAKTHFANNSQNMKGCTSVLNYKVKIQI